MSTRMLAMAPRVTSNPAREGMAPVAQHHAGNPYAGQNYQVAGLPPRYPYPAPYPPRPAGSRQQGARKPQIVTMTGTQRWRELGIRDT